MKKGACVEASPSRLVSLLVMVASVNYLCRINMTVVAPGLMSRFHLSQTQMGEVFSAFTIGYTAFQIPSGWLADRIPIRQFFLTVTWAWTLLTLAMLPLGWPVFQTTAAAVPLLLALRFAFGVVSAPTYPASGRAIGTNLPSELHGRANGFVIASVGIGAACTPLLIGTVSARWGWQPALALAALLSAGCAIIWGKWAPRQPRLPRAAKGQLPDPGAGAAVQSRGRQSQEPQWPSPLRQSGFWCLALSYTLEGYVAYVFLYWFYLYLVQVRNFQLSNAALLTSLPWICSLIAIPAGGALSDLCVKAWGATWGRRAVPVCGLLSAAALLAFGALTERVSLAVAALTLSTALLLTSEGPYWAAMNQLSGPHSGVGGGVMNFGGNLGGILSPVLTPWLAVRLGWGPALALTALVAVGAALLWMGFNSLKQKAAPVSQHWQPGEA